MLYQILVNTPDHHPRRHNDKPYKNGTNGRCVGGICGGGCLGGCAWTTIHGGSGVERTACIHGAHPHHRPNTPTCCSAFKILPMQHDKNVLLYFLIMMVCVLLVHTYLYTRTRFCTYRHTCLYAHTFVHTHTQVHLHPLSTTLIAPLCQTRYAYIKNMHAPAQPQ